MFLGRKCKITFIRHGATINTDENRFYDNEAYPAVNAAGIREMNKISQWVKNKGLKIDKIYASSALRTVQSADILSSVCGHNFEILESLNSRKSGIWNGLTYEEIDKKYPNLLDEYLKKPKSFCPEGAEPVSDFNKRVADSLNEIIKNNLYKRLIIITHGEVIQAAIANILNIPPENQFKIYIPTGSATQISYFENFASLVYSAYIPI